MLEYFDISFVLKKLNSVLSETDINLEKMGLWAGENEMINFIGKKAVVSYFEDENADFDTITVSFHELAFHAQNFYEELKPFTCFVNSCFESNDKIQLALCSYEINGYLISGIDKIEDFNNEIQSKFPILYRRNSEFKTSDLVINLTAQDIFSDR